ncbi:MAG: ANTAR domain-containing protein [Solobacterium sp.]|nr:ANTAR domain-containing protein [Solobacterium sp.]MBR2794799.1 ANTAR domain-containing protein [Solobacterium sp.]
MTKITVSFSRIDDAEQVAGMLKENGYEIARICTSGAEVIRTYNTLQDGILVSGYRLRDRLLDSFAEDLNENIQILCLAKPEQLNRLSAKKIFRLPLPSSRAAILASVELLIQLHYQRLPHREKTSDDMVERAKAYLMETRGLSEFDAHRYMQRESMRFGVKMTLVAERILENKEI